MDDFERMTEAGDEKSVLKVAQRNTCKAVILMNIYCLFETAGNFLIKYAAPYGA